MWANFDRRHPLLVSHAHRIYLLTEYCKMVEKLHSVTFFMLFLDCKICHHSDNENYSIIASFEIGYKTILPHFMCSLASILHLKFGFQFHSSTFGIDCGSFKILKHIGNLLFDIVRILIEKLMEKLHLCLLQVISFIKNEECLIIRKLSCAYRKEKNGYCLRFWFLGHR